MKLGYFREMTKQYSDDCEIIVNWELLENISTHEVDGEEEDKTVIIFAGEKWNNDDTKIKEEK